METQQQFKAGDIVRVIDGVGYESIAPAGSVGVVESAESVHAFVRSMAGVRFGARVVRMYFYRLELVLAALRSVGERFAVQAEIVEVDERRAAPYRVRIGLHESVWVSEDAILVAAPA